MDIIEVSTNGNVTKIKLGVGGVVMTDITVVNYEVFIEKTQQVNIVGVETVAKIK